MMTSVVPARAEHVLTIACRVRDADRQEIMASTNTSVLQAIYRSYRLSTHAWTGMIDNEPVIIFGVSPVSILGGVGAPWLIGTDAVTRARKTFVRDCRKYADQMQATYPELYNFVDARNKASIRWLRWLGFTIEPEVQYGLNGEMFHPFRRVA